MNIKSGGKLSDKIGFAILAAGKGTRTKLDKPKVLLPIFERSLIEYVLTEIEKYTLNVSYESIIGIVVGHKAAEVQKFVEEKKKLLNTYFPIQKEQKGTADALKSYFNCSDDFWKCKYTFVVCGDTPLISSEIYQKMYQQMRVNSELMGVAATFETTSPHGYGRILRDKNGFQIIEEKDANEEIKKITEVNSGFYLFNTEHIKENLFNIDDKNQSNEYYLTDLFQKNFNVMPICFKDANMFKGVNTLVHLEKAERVLQMRKIEEIMETGVRFINASTCTIGPEVTIGKGSTIYPGVVIEGNTTIGENCIIEAGCIIKRSKINTNCCILGNSYIEESEIGSNSSIGPFARLRTGTVIGTECKVGNFVETKKVVLDKGVKVSHLSYVGDAEIGEDTNIGCGFITCNYDGAEKHKTTIGKNCFIGSDTQVIAPLNIGDSVFIASGSTINQDVPTNAFAIARQKQVNKENMAQRFIKKKK